jgi:DNA-binding NarL/FixJ family response regulator
VLKDDSVEDLVARIRGAEAGRAQVSPRIAAALRRRVSEYAQLLEGVEVGVGEAEELTPREQEILELIGEGLTNQQIAEELVIEVGTVQNHVHSILQNLDANSRREAAAYLVLLE